MSAAQAGAALRFDGVCKRFGKRQAVDALSFEVPTGSVTGLIGPNGAGKTTTFGLVSGFLQPDEGELSILGLSAFDPVALRGRLGVLPQDAELPPRHTPHEFVFHLARLQGMGRAQATAMATRRLTDVGLADRAKDRISALSHGMRRRLAVASALVGEPELLLLDEPMAGLDPVQVAGVRSLISGLAGEATVVVSSHDLDELERLCDWVVLLDAGRCVQQGTVASITGQGERMQWVLAASTVGQAVAQAVREALPGWTVQTGEGKTGATLDLRAPPNTDVDTCSVAVMAALVSHHVGVRSVRRGERLEQAYVERARG